MMRCQLLLCVAAFCLRSLPTEGFTSTPSLVFRGSRSGVVSLGNRAGIVSQRVRARGGVAMPMMAATPQSTPSTQELIAAAEEFMVRGSGYFSARNESLLAEDFVFRGPIIGPFNKADYMEVLDYFKVYRGFPDINPNCFGYSVDPEDPLRVWFFVRATGTNTMKLGGPLGDALAAISPPSKATPYRGSPEAWSLTFNNKLQVRRLTAGYVADRFDEKATTGGRGLTYGITATLGLPLPAANAPQTQIAQFLSSLGGPLFPKSSSEPSQVPAWWKDKRRGAE
eukprot:2964018-Rhodomonas_salina.2